ncbi:DUF4215 domain-containing protein [Nannocystis punicea]|uniref:DUF4215 domain-containing protein n=1 Tax=Nannocystis punicea TaxID=2995304 RepID=A0ABY7H1S0_9BACT|nr:DUF4215 domain-containing protein [Nannocystis poenicansa]WAS93208.1 DUF4215 domain-containing protein [Nannocystis poenicansa]
MVRSSVWGLAVLWVAACSGGEALDTGSNPFTTMPPAASMATTVENTSTGAPTTGTPTTSTSDGGSDSEAGTTTDGATDSTTGMATATATATATMGTTGEPDPVCGNGIIETGEACDDGNQIDTDACRNSCVAAACGDGVVQMGAEACDDGNQVDDDACSNACKAGACGDGVVQMGEACDDGNIVNEDACLNTCAVAKCGDSVVQAGIEVCDGGGETPQCNGDCTAAACGDGKVNAAAGEQCDAAGQTAQCDDDCTTAACGDGKINPAAGEDCDDGNANNNDGCSSVCKIEVFAQKCQQGNDPGTGSPWVVCDANANWAWVSANNQGSFHHELICQNLGYSGVGQIGGTCGDVCGYCQGGSSCQANGQQTFDGGGACGSDGLGPLLCVTVHWTCVK